MPLHGGKGVLINTTFVLLSYSSSIPICLKERERHSNILGLFVQSILPWWFQSCQFLRVQPVHLPKTCQELDSMLRNIYPSKE